MTCERPQKFQRKAQRKVARQAVSAPMLPRLPREPISRGRVYFRMNGEPQIHALKLDNPFSGRIAKHFDARISHRRELSYRCGGCGQRVNARDLGQVFHHETPGHRPIAPQLVS